LNKGRSVLLLALLEPVCVTYVHLDRRMNGQTNRQMHGRGEDGRGGGGEGGGRREEEGGGGGRGKEGGGGEKEKKEEEEGEEEEETFEK
jgi:hypothetical protein